MCLSMKLLFTLFTVVVAQQCKPEDNSQGSCLLAKKKVMGKVSLIQEQSMAAFEQLSLKQKDWRIRHLSVEASMNTSKTLLDRFIDAQTTSSSHCSSRLMESKRILDGILADARTLNGQVTSRQQVLEVETENLKITKMSIDATVTEYKQSITICKEERKEAFVELKKYSQELEELKSIANPSMRMEISHSVKIERHDASEEPVKPTGIEKDIALVQFSKEMCEAFVTFSQRHGRHKVVDDPEKESRDCDKQREELQKAFEEAYKETRELKETTRLRTIDQTCFTTAETVKTAELVPLVSQRDVAVEKIEVASQAIAALDPVLTLVKDKAEKLRTHISETLTPECMDAGEASKLLVRVRELIISLEECPGRNDFKLKIPSVQEEEGPPVKETPEDEGPPVEKAPEDAEEAPEGPPVEKPTEAPEDEPTEAPEEEETPTEAPEDEPTEAPEEEPPSEEEGAALAEIPEEFEPSEKASNRKGGEGKRRKGRGRGSR